MIFDFFMFTEKSFKILQFLYYFQFLVKTHHFTQNYTFWHFKSNPWKFDKFLVYKFCFFFLWQMFILPQGRKFSSMDFWFFEITFSLLSLLRLSKFISITKYYRKMEFLKILKFKFFNRNDFY